MKIAQVAPLMESVPPQGYGGTERVVSYLTEELVRQGHDVTLFASGDSVTQAKLEPAVDRALRLSRNCRDPLAWHMLMLRRVAELAHTFDIVHFHIDYLHFPMSQVMREPSLTTLHGRLDLAEHQAVYNAYDDQPLISISNAQREPVPGLNWLANVYHGLPRRLYRFQAQSGGYLAFLGRISPEKRVDRAIEIARRSGRELVIAAKVDPVDQAYFEAEIEPLLASPGVRFVGEVDDRTKAEILGSAYALVFPIDWPEPFGLVLIEAMACGTPVIAFRRGSVPEVVDHGRSGLVVDDMDGAVAAVDAIATLDRTTCRRVFERRFSVRRMAREYLAAYRRIIDVELASSRAAS
ncbi:MAG TPA: glycosyltransferase family 4 protein [Gammaproteobacteria bacterium]|nr:glycosyltransferase family 4 protein [Gammaproteobacteria bacterium]